MFELKPMNKYLVIEPIKEDEKVGKEGIIIAPGNALEKQYRLARIVAKPDECDEAEQLSVGDTVLYDAVGAVTHRVGKQGFTTVKVLNVLAVVREQVKVVTKFDEILEIVGPVAMRTGSTEVPFEEVTESTVIAISEDTRRRQIELATKESGVKFPTTEKVGTIEYPLDLAKERA